MPCLLLLNGQIKMAERNEAATLITELNILKQDYEKLKNELLVVESKYQSTVNDTSKIVDGENNVSTRLQIMVASLFNNQLYSDLLILLKGGVQVRAHKLILAASGGDFGVADFSHPHVTMIDLTDMRYEVSYTMIKWAYTDEFDFHHKINESFLIELLQASTLCKLKSLHIRCQKALISILTLHTGNCNKLYHVAEQLGAHLLREHCIKLLDQLKNPELMQPAPQRVIIEQMLNEPPTNYQDDVGVQFENNNKNNVIEDNVINNNNNDDDDDDCGNVNDNGSNDDDANEDVCTPTVEPEVKTQIKKKVVRQTEIRTRSSARRSKQVVESSKKSKIIKPKIKLVKNNKKVLKESEYTCDVCGKTFKNPHNLNMHKIAHMEEKPYKCDVCDKSFSTTRYLNMHVVSHSQEQPYQCKCGKRFKIKSFFSKHKNLFPNDIHRHCSVCDKIFENDEELQKHNCYVRPPRQPKPINRCDICDKILKNKPELKEHYLTVHGVKKRCRCHICGKSVCSKYFKTHVEMHSGIRKVRPYVCHVCGKTLSNNGAYSLHLKIHTGEKPYKCDVCEKLFRAKSDLSIHRRMHTGEKPFICSFCGEQYRCSSRLGYHIRKHHHEEPPEDKFACELCDKTFNNRNARDEHVTKFHSESLLTVSTQESEFLQPTTYDPTLIDQFPTFLQ